MSKKDARLILQAMLIGVTNNGQLILDRRSIMIKAIETAINDLIEHEND